MAITISGNGISSDAIASLAASKLTGQVPDANAPSGSVIQVVSTTKTDTFSTTSLNDNPAAVTGLSISITPSSSSNKVLVSGHLSLGYQSGVTQCFFRLYRNGTHIGGGDAASNRPSVMGRTYVPDSGTAGTVGFAFLDSPSTTSSTTYQIYIGTEGSGTVTLNRTLGDGDNRTGARMSSTITAQEIAA